MSIENQSRKLLEQICDGFLFHLFVEKDSGRYFITKLNEVTNEDQQEDVINDVLRYIFTSEIYEDMESVNIYNWYEKYDARLIKEILTDEEELNDIFIEINLFVEDLYEMGGFNISRNQNWHDVILCHFLYIYVLPLASDFDIFRSFINNIMDSVICPK
jgi:hypothetical protein